MITRKQYFHHEVTHAEYYRDVYKAAGIVIRDNELLDCVREALAAGDEHLNTIPLGRWDAMATGSRRPLDRALKERGDFWSLGNGVCAFKQAARDAAEASS